MVEFIGEPTLDEVLSDPAIRAVMRSDGVDPRTLRLFLRDMSRMTVRPASRLAAPAQRAA